MNKSQKTAYNEENQSGEFYLDSTSTQKAIRKLWGGVVDTYTKRKLTKEQDKLIAISAIVRELQPSIKSAYIAGIWEIYLPLDLLWHVRSTIKSPQKDKEYCAPSWSWASSETSRVMAYDYLITIEDFEFKTLLLQILEFEVRTKTSDFMGQVTGGYLLIWGWLLAFRHLKSEHLVEGSHSVILYGKMIGRLYLDQLPNFEWEEMYFLPFIKRIKDIHFGFVDGLVILKTGKQNQYRRVGFFEIQDELEFFTKPMKGYEKIAQDENKCSEKVRHLSLPPNFRNKEMLDDGEWKRGDIRTEGDWVESVFEII